MPPALQCRLVMWTSLLCQLIWAQQLFARHGCRGEARDNLVPGLLGPSGGNAVKMCHKPHCVDNLPPESDCRTIVPARLAPGLSKAVVLMQASIYHWHAKDT